MEEKMTNSLLPIVAPPVLRHGMAGSVDGIELLGCPWWKWVKCGAAFAACASLSGPAFIACVAAVAGDCVECVT